MGCTPPAAWLDPATLMRSDGEDGLGALEPLAAAGGAGNALLLVLACCGDRQMKA